MSTEQPDDRLFSDAAAPLYENLPYRRHDVARSASLLTRADQTHGHERILENAPLIAPRLVSSLTALDRQLTGQLGQYDHGQRSHQHDQVQLPRNPGYGEPQHQHQHQQPPGRPSFENAMYEEMRMQTPEVGLDASSGRTASRQCAKDSDDDGEGVLVEENAKGPLLFQPSVGRPTLRRPRQGSMPDTPQLQAPAHAKAPMHDVYVDVATTMAEQTLNQHLGTQPGGSLASPLTLEGSRNFAAAGALSEPQHSEGSAENGDVSAFATVHRFKQRSQMRRSRTTQGNFSGGLEDGDGGDDGRGTENDRNGGDDDGDRGVKDANTCISNCDDEVWVADGAVYDEATEGVTAYDAVCLSDTEAEQAVACGAEDSRGTVVGQSSSVAPAFVDGGDGEGLDHLHADVMAYDDVELEDTGADCTK